MKLGLGCCCDESSSDESTSGGGGGSVSTFSGSTIDTTCDVGCDLTPRYWDVVIPELDAGVSEQPYSCNDWLSGKTHQVQSVGGGVNAGCAWHFYPTPETLQSIGPNPPIITPEDCESPPFRCYVIWHTRCGNVDDMPEFCNDPPHTSRFRTDDPTCRDARLISRILRDGTCREFWYERALPTQRVPCYSSGTLGGNAIVLTLAGSQVTGMRDWTLKVRKTTISRIGGNPRYATWDHTVWKFSEPITEPCDESKELTQTGPLGYCSDFKYGAWSDFLKFPAGSTVTITPRGSKY